jgi:cytoskeletal protein RodZ
MLPSLGQRLQHAREQRGLSLRDVAHKTRIPLARLQDLEEDKLNGFGGMTYAKSFLRTYSTLLEVEAEAVLSQMTPPPLGGPRDYRYLVDSQGPWVVPRRERSHARHSPTALTVGNSFLVAAVVCVVFGLFIGGAVLANAYLNSKSASSTAADEERTAAQRSPASTTRPAATPPSEEPWAADPSKVEEALNRLGGGVSAGRLEESNPGQPASLIAPAPPKAEAVEEARRALPVAPKAEAVR